MTRLPCGLRGEAGGPQFAPGWSMAGVPALRLPRQRPVPQPVRFQSGCDRV